jgi:hypothetical protein
MERQLTFSEITDQRTLTESTKPATDDTPETLTVLLVRAQQHTTNVEVEHLPDLRVETVD